LKDILLSVALYHLQFMPYKFTFDISKKKYHFFTGLVIFGYQMGISKVFFKNLQTIIRKFRIQEVAGFNIEDPVVLIQDLIDMKCLNLIHRQKFLQTKKRALFLPHCSRKYMDNRCKAVFETNLPSYVCAHCSPDCSVNKASHVGKEKGYDIYVLPGGSCITKILKTKKYKGIVGVACGEEAKMSGELLSSMSIAWQSVPLLKNGCANTVFNIETLIKTL
jgi:hypothetical protein